MKTPLSPNLLVRSALTLGFALCLYVQPIHAAEPAPSKSMMGEKSMMNEPAMDRCQMFQNGQQKMMHEMAAQDTALDAAIVKMNAAKGDEKLSQLAAIVTGLVEQRSVMRNGMTTMQNQTMMHTMQHMQDDPESMSKCPMMKDMSGMREKAEMGPRR